MGPAVKPRGFERPDKSMSYAATEGASMYKKILVATDLLETSQFLITLAQEVAKVHQASLDILHVIEPPMSAEYAAALGFATFPDPSTEGAALVLKALAEANNIAPEQQHVEVGHIRNEIIETAMRLHCDLIIIGSHAAPGISQLLGRTAHSVLHHAPCDVLMARVK
jgi:nucleotide-binding universal stress UspA family protein